MYVPAAGKRDKLGFIRQQLREGRQAYFVYPLVDESDKIALQSAIKAHQELTGAFKEFRVGLLHGRMKPGEKRAAMEAFRAGRLHVLVSTVVIEVGVDVPNASVLAVLHAERFGLSQLHQLRGRIGRGPHPSWCLLFTDAEGGTARRRIDALLETDDGFRIAEEDFRIRGPGEFFGTRQSGVPDLHFPEALLDAPLVDKARRWAREIVAGDPSLAGPGRRGMREAILRRFADRIDLVRV